MHCRRSIQKLLMKGPFMLPIAVIYVLAIKLRLGNANEIKHRKFECLPMLLRKVSRNREVN